MFLNPKTMTRNMLLTLNHPFVVPNLNCPFKKPLLPITNDIAITTAIQPHSVSCKVFKFKKNQYLSQMKRVSCNHNVMKLLNQCMHKYLTLSSLYIFLHSLRICNVLSKNYISFSDCCSKSAY